MHSLAYIGLALRHLSQRRGLRTTRRARAAPPVRNLAQRLNNTCAAVLLVGALAAGNAKATTELPQSGPAERISWEDALRQHDWVKAASTLAGLSDAGEQVAGISCPAAAVDPAPRATEPTLAASVRKLARAVTALELQAADDALCALQDLEQELPSLGPELKTLRALAQVRSAGVAEFVPELRQSRDTRLLLNLLERLLDEAEESAASSVAAVLYSSKKDSAEQTRYRALRARWAWARKQSYRAYLDWRWLVETHPETAEAEHALKQLGAHFPNHPLKAQERYHRARKLAEAGRPEALNAELAELAELKYRLGSGQILKLRAQAAYRARDFAAAAPLFEASFEHTRAQSTLYDAANAYSRAGRADKAITLFGALSREQPRTSMTGLALFKLAREYSYAGNWEAAEAAFSKYLRTYPGGEYVTAAAAERALAWYALGKFRHAAAEFNRLAKLRPGSSDSQLYYCLVAISQLQSGDPKVRNHALEVLTLAESQNPLGFAAWRARIRLARQANTQQAERPVNPTAEGDNPSTNASEPPAPLGSSNVAKAHQVAPSLFIASHLRSVTAAEAAPQGLAAPSLELTRLPLLEQGGQLLVPPETDSAFATSPPLPELVLELENSGLLHLAKRAMKSEARIWLRASEATEEDSCRSLQQLSDGRQRYLRGIDAARRTGLFLHPESTPRWVWECVYPTPYPAFVAAAATEFSVPFALVYAVMRQESGYRPSVLSPADARGLMQIIPKTGQQIARELGISYTDSLLLDPRTNIRFGTYYLSTLLKRFDNNPAVVAAAYNAGPEAAGLWSDHLIGLPVELFALRIPYKETKNYVQRVLANYFTYRALYPEAL